jgi:hypothetical protein
MNKLARRMIIAALCLGVTALFAWGLVYVDGLFGVDHVKGIQFHLAASRWTLQRVEAAPERVDGVVAGMRVKAILELSRDIQTDTAPRRFAAAMPFGLDPGLRGPAFDPTLFLTHSDPVIKRNGQVVSTRDGGEWVQAGVVPKGVYEVEQVFWMAGVTPLKDRLVFLSLTRSAYFNAYNTTPYRDLTQLCQDNRAHVRLDRLATLDKQVAKVRATAGFFNGDRINAKQEYYATALKTTAFAYNHREWIDALQRRTLPDCDAVYETVEKEVAAMKVQLADLEGLRDQLRLAAEWSRGTSVFSKVRLATRSMTQDELLRRFSDIDCQDNGICRLQSLGCQVVFQNARERFPPRTPVEGVVHSSHLIDSTAHLKEDHDERYFLFQPDAPDAQPGLCIVIKNDERLLDPLSLARSAPATMQCEQNGCVVNVPQWPRDPGWLADKARRGPEIASSLAQTEATLKLAGSRPADNAQAIPRR